MQSNDRKEQSKKAKHTVGALKAAAISVYGAVGVLDDMSHDVGQSIHQAIESIEEERSNMGSSYDRAVLDEYSDEIVRAQQALSRNITETLNYAGDLRIDLLHQLDSVED